MESGVTLPDSSGMNISTDTGIDFPTEQLNHADKSTLISVIETLAGELSSVKSELSEVKSEVEDIRQQTIESQQETIDEQQNQIESQQDEIQELRHELTEHQERSGRKIAETKKDVNQIEESLEGDTTPTPNDGQTAIQEHDLTPIEQISRAEDPDDITDSPSVRRAISLFKNISDWGSRTPKGIVLKSSDNPLSLLSADMDNSLCWKQYYRAAEALESLSKGAVTFINSDRHGKMLILHQKSEVYQRMMNGSLSMSSEGTTV